MPTDPEPIPIPPRFESLAERLIREAMERGEFDHLPGAGRPIPDLDVEYDPGWWARRWVEHNRMLDRVDDLARAAARERLRVRVPSLAADASARLAALEEEIARIDAGLPPGGPSGPRTPPGADR